MKKFLILFSSAIFCCGYGQFDSTMKVVKTSSEIGFLFHETEGVFKEVFTFQFESEEGKSIRPTLETVKYKRYNFELNKKSLIIYYDDHNYEIYTISDNKKGKNVFIGYGLAHKVGAFVLNEIGEQTSVFELIAPNKVNFVEEGKKPMKCHSGGEGANSCSVGSPFIGGGCSVSCNSGYYACCNQARNDCMCIAEKPNNSKVAQVQEVEVSNIQQPQKIRLVENPITNNINFALNGEFQREKMSDYRIEIFDHMGNSVYKNQLSPSIDFLQQRSGFYIFVITDGKGYLEKGKLIKN